MSQADEAMCFDMAFCKKKGISEKRQHTRYSSVVRVFLTRACDQFSFNLRRAPAWRSRDLAHFSLSLQFPTVVGCILCFWTDIFIINVGSRKHSLIAVSSHMVAEQTFGKARSFVW